MIESQLQTYANELRKVTEQYTELCNTGDALVREVHRCEDELDKAGANLRAHVAYTDNVLNKRNALMQRMRECLDAGE